MTVAEVRARWFTLPKAGNLDEENEDAFAAAEDWSVVAVADGATEGPFSRDWANFLVQRFVSTARDPGSSVSRSSASFESWLSSTALAWSAISPPQDSDLATAKPWYVERARAQGGFATLVGLTVDAEESASSKSIVWRAVIAGDSCLFHIRDGRVRQMWPAYTSADFAMSPMLLSSVGMGNEQATASALFVNDELAVGDRLLIVTDALAAWIVAALASDHGGETLTSLLKGDIPPANDLIAFIARERLEGRIRNDDCTMVALDRVSAAPEE
jgi:hypothetical protein